MPRRIARPATIAWTLSLAGCLAAMSGCLPASMRNAPSPAPVVLSVENEGFNDLVIFVTAAEGERQRLGIAHAIATTNFVIPQRFVTGGPNLRFLADDITGSRPEVSRRTSVSPGDTVMMVIQNTP